MIIKLKTSASKSVAPDYMKIIVTLKSLNMDKNLAMNTVANNFNSIKDYFLENNINENLKTNSYKVEESKKRESYKEVVHKTEYTRYRDVFQGFLVTQVVELSIPIDVLFATKLIALKSKENEIYINVSYFLKDSKEFQDKVIKEALKRAGEEALVIAKTFDKNHTTCVLVDYTYNPYSGYSRAAVSMEKCMMANSFDEIEQIAETLEPVDITLTENVYTEWEI